MRIYRIVRIYPLSPIVGYTQKDNQQDIVKKQVIPYLLGSDFRGVKGFKVNLTLK